MSRKLLFCGREHVGFHHHKSQMALLCQEAMTGCIIGLKAGLSTIILLHGHNIKSPTNGLLL